MDELKFRDIPLEFHADKNGSHEHVREDFAALERSGIDKLIRERFLPWLKGDQFPDRDDEQIMAGLKLYEFSYAYLPIVAKYSPTGEDGLFGEFELCFESANEYTEDMLEAVAMQVYVFNGEVVKVSGYDI